MSILAIIHMPHMDASTYRMVICILAAAAIPAMAYEVHKMIRDSINALISIKPFRLVTMISSHKTDNNNPHVSTIELIDISKKRSSDTENKKEETYHDA